MIIRDRWTYRCPTNEMLKRDGGVDQLLQAVSWEENFVGSRRIIPYYTRNYAQLFDVSFRASVAGPIQTLAVPDTYLTEFLPIGRHVYFDAHLL